MITKDNFSFYVNYIFYSQGGQAQGPRTAPFHPLSLRSQEVEQIPQHKTRSYKMPVLDREIILLLADGRLQCLTGERRARPLKNASHDFRPAHQ